MKKISKMKVSETLCYNIEGDFVIKIAIDEESETIIKFKDVEEAVLVVKQKGVSDE